MPPTVDATLRRWPSYLTADHRRLTKQGAVALIVIAAALAVAGTIGIAATVGFGPVLRRAARVQWPWLFAALGGVAISYLGYLFAYVEVVRAEGGPRLRPGRALAAVLTGFAAFIPRGGFALDRDVWCDHGVERSEARVRVLSLAVLEYVPLAPAALGAAAWLLVAHARTEAGVVPSWLIGVPVGAVVVLGMLALQRRMGRTRTPWRQLSHALDAVRQTLGILRCQKAGPLAIAGMTAYWIGDIFALWACFQAFDGRAPIPELIVGYATGYALTRRSLPLAGAGAVEVLLPFALSWVSLPLASAVVAVFIYRLFNLWLPVAPAAAGLRHLRRNQVVPPAPLRA